MHLYKHSLNYIPLIILQFLLFASCEQENSDIGKEFIDINSKVTFVDTLDVQASTVLFDSIQTSGQNVILCGIVSDDKFGTNTVTSFVQLRIPGVFSDTTDIKYDSISFIIYTNKYVCGDTLQNYKISVHELTNNFEFNKDDESLYNTTSKIKYAAGSLGIYSGKPRPNLIPKLSVQLPDERGKKLLDFLKNENRNTDATSRQANFLKEFKGLALVPGSNNKTILGFSINDTSAFMRLYYHIGDKKVAKYIDFSSSYQYVNGSLQYKQYNQIIADRQGTTYFANKKDTAINSTSTGNMAYMQGGTGMAIRFQFPTIKDIMLASKYTKIVKAELIIKPVIKSYADFATVPSQMLLYQSDQDYNLISAVTNTYDSNTNYGNLSLDYFYPQNSFYSYDITKYINSLLNTEDISNLGLLFLCPNFSTTLNKLIIGDRRNQNNPLSLKVYYLNYAE